METSKRLTAKAVGLFFVPFPNTISVFTLAIGTCGAVFFRYYNLVLGKNV